MKKQTILIAYLFLGISLSGSSQDNKIHIGAGIGPALTNLRFEDSLDVYSALLLPSSNASSNIHISLFCDIRISQSIFLGSGLNLRSKGIRSDELDIVDASGNQIRDGRQYIVFDYLTIPVMINYYTGNKVKFRFGLGAYYGSLLKAKVISPVIVEGQSGISDVTDEYSSSDFGLSAQMGFMIPIVKRLNFNFDIVEEFGLKSISHQNDDVQLYISGFKSRSLSTRIGIVYSF